jgi:hypothetical protein
VRIGVDRLDLPNCHVGVNFRRDDTGVADPQAHTSWRRIMQDARKNYIRSSGGSRESRRQRGGPELGTAARINENEGYFSCIIVIVCRLRSELSRRELSIRPAGSDGKVCRADMRDALCAHGPRLEAREFPVLMTRGPDRSPAGAVGRFHLRHCGAVV